MSRESLDAAQEDLRAAELLLRDPPDSGEPWYTPQGLEELKKRLEAPLWIDAAHAILRETERSLSLDLKRLRKTVAALEKELRQRGKRRGRPRALSPSEVRLAGRLKGQGKTWEQVRQELNSRRHHKNVLSVTTIKSAVAVFSWRDYTFGPDPDEP